jgi:hypothetical protein
LIARAASPSLLRAFATVSFQVESQVAKVREQCRGATGTHPWKEDVAYVHFELIQVHL